MSQNFIYSAVGCQLTYTYMQILQRSPSIKSQNRQSYKINRYAIEIEGGCSCFIKGQLSFLLEDIHLLRGFYECYCFEHYNCYKMRQKFWKELKSHLCPRENWVQDDTVNKCQCCGKDFTFFRRRHHCRFCGKLFCSHCSDLYINGSYLGLSEKYVRHCQFCKQEIQKIKRDLNRLIAMVEDQQDFTKQQQDDSSNSSSDQGEGDEYQSVRVVFGSLYKENDYKYAESLDSEIKTLFKKMLLRLSEIGNINEQFIGGRLLQILMRLVIQTKMNILPNDLNSTTNYMDISKHVSIKIINGDPGQHIQLIKGIVLQKNLPMKHMLNRLIKPQVILIENSLDESGVKARFEDLISNQQAILQDIEEKIMRINPDIVFVEKSINREVLEFFSERAITVLSGLKKKDMLRIVQIAGIRNTVKNVWTIDKYKPSNIIGNIDLMHIKTFEKNTQPLIYLQKNSGIYTILLSQKTYQAKSNLKKSTNVLLKFMRQIHLQKYLIYVDHQMWQQRQFRNVPRLYKIYPFHINNLQKMKCEQISFYHLRMSQMKAEKLGDHKIRDYCKMKNRSQFLENCGFGKRQIITPYSQQDYSIGHFLLNMATNLSKRCSDCQLIHRQRFYFTKHGIQISVTKIQNEEMNQDKIFDEDDLNIEKMRRYLQKYKENWNIFTHFQCKKCKIILSKRIKIGKNYLRNSLYYFLFLISNSEEWLPQQVKRNNRPISSQMSNQSQKQCAHNTVIRVLETSDVIFSMQVYSINQYQISRIDLREQEYKSIMRQSLKNYIVQTIRQYMQSKSDLLQSILNIVNSYIRLLEPFRFQEAVSSKLVIQLQKLQTIQEILDKLKQHLDDLWSKEKAKQVTCSTDWTFAIRQIAKLDYIFKTTLEILRVIEGNLYKRKKKIQENEMMSVYSGDQNDPLISDHEQKEEMFYRLSKDENNDDFQFHRISSRDPERLEVPEFLEKQLSRQKSSDDPERREDKYSLRSYSKKSVNQKLNFNLVYNDSKLRTYSQQMRRRRYQLKKGVFLYFNLVNYKKPLSILVCCLNSPDFKESFEKKPQEVFRFNLILNKDIPTSWDLKQKIDKIKEQTIYDESQTRESFEVTAYFHRQFQQLREKEGISQQLYIKSLANCQFWETVGGKSNSEFAKSRNELLVIKKIKSEQFQEFLKFAFNYLSHLQQLSGNSVLTRIYGIYEITIRGDTFKYVVMQNLFLGFEGLPVIKYDLKGSEGNRLFVCKGSDTKFTGLDTNFKIDKNYHPYCISQASFRLFFEALEDDIAFLRKNNVIDYSLLVIEHGQRIRVGIIDFMRPYHLLEKIENKYKQLTNKTTPTVIPPPQYAQRFLAAMKKYFIFYS